MKLPWFRRRYRRRPSEHNCTRRISSAPMIQVSKVVPDPSPPTRPPPPPPPPPPLPVQLPQWQTGSLPQRPQFPLVRAISKRGGLSISTAPCSPSSARSPAPSPPPSKRTESIVTAQSSFIVEQQRLIKKLYASLERMDKIVHSQRRELESLSWLPPPPTQLPASLDLDLDHAQLEEKLPTLPQTTPFSELLSDDGDADNDGGIDAALTDLGPTTGEMGNSLPQISPSAFGAPVNLFPDSPTLSEFSCIRPSIVPSQASETLRAQRAVVSSLAPAVPAPAPHRDVLDARRSYLVSSIGDLRSSGSTAVTATTTTTTTTTTEAAGAGLRSSRIPRRRPTAKELLVQPGKRVQAAEKMLAWRGEGWFQTADGRYYRAVPGNGEEGGFF
jgi:hypothetical protein